jgi:hypothetical protein
VRAAQMERAGDEEQLVNETLQRDDSLCGRCDRVKQFSGFSLHVAKRGEALRGDGRGGAEFLREK